MYDFIRTKFKQSKDYSQDMLVRDLIQLCQELSRTFDDQDVRFGDIESAASSLSGRVSAIEALNLGPRMSAAELDISNLEAWKPGVDALLTSQGNRITTLENMFEVGTWTPDLRFANAKVGLTYSANAYSRKGRYMRIGKLAFAWFEIELSNKGTSAGVAAIYGLPSPIFDGISVANFAPGWFSFVSGVANTSGYFGFECMGWSVANAINLYQAHSASGINMTEVNFTNASFMVGGIMYIMP